MKIPQKPRDFKKIVKEMKSEKLFKLVEKKEIVEFLAYCNAQYFHWDELRQRKIPNDAKPELIWTLMKIFRENRSKKIKFGKEVFRYTLLDETLRKLHILDMTCAGHLETGFDPINLEGKERYIVSSLMEEAIASSQLEGAITTRKIAKEMLRANKKPTDYSGRMIVNGYRTMQRIMEMIKEKEDKITPKAILELQESITKGTLKNEEDAGRFRQSDDIILGDGLDPGKIYYTPPSHKKIPKLINEICEFANTDDDGFMHPVIKGIILHFMIGYIHPFNDGNGRTARALFYWYVLTRGYWLFEYMPVSRILLRSRSKYSRSYLYTETDDNDLTYFIKYNLSAIEEALSDMKEYISRKQKEQAEAIKLIQESKDLNLRQADILKKFMKNPEKKFTIKEIMNTYGVVYQTARNDLLHLVELGHLNKFLSKNKFVFVLDKREENN